MCVWEPQMSFQGPYFPTLPSVAPGRQIWFAGDMILLLATFFKIPLVTILFSCFLPSEYVNFVKNYNWNLFLLKLFHFLLFTMQFVWRRQLFVVFVKAISFQVKASSVIGEADQVQKGIVDLVTVHNVRKLVIGAIPEK